MIPEELLKIAKPLLSGKEIIDLVIGLRYTAVLLDEDYLGIAYTLKGPFLTRKKGIFSRNPEELADLITSTSPVEASLGLAAVNAASQMKASEADLLESKRLLDELKLGKHDSILMVGLMLPIAWELYEFVDKIWAVEDSFSTKEGPPNLEVRPWWALDLILEKEKISALIVSGSAVANKTIDHILRISEEYACKLALVGPSVPIFPNFWKRKGVEVLGASIVEKPRETLELIKMGRGSREFFRRGCLRKVLINLKS